MTGWMTIKKIEAVEDAAHSIGFKVGPPRHGGWNQDPKFIDTITLMPLDQELPIYTRDVELWEGTIDQAAEFLKGIQWARNYDAHLKLSSEEKRRRKEQDERNRQLMQTLKEGKYELQGGL